MKKKTLTYEEYNQLKQAVEALRWTWQEYQQQFPDGWYGFKYQPILRQVVEKDKEESLLAKAQFKPVRKRVNLSLAVYQELKELATISLELQDVLAHPPYGSVNLTLNVSDEKER